MGDLAIAPLIDTDLCVRPFLEADAAQFAEAVRESMATVGKWMPWCRPDYSDDDALEWITSCSTNLQAKLAYDVGIFDANGHELIGGISINQINRTHNFGTIGYWVRQSRQRKGIAAHAVKMMAAFGFHELKLTRVEIVAAPNNVPSRKTAERAGATFECIAQNRLVVRGEPQPGAVYSLIPLP